MLRLGINAAMTTRNNQLLPGQLFPPASGPTLDLRFVDNSEPTVTLDFTVAQYAIYEPDSTGTPVGRYLIWM